MFGFILTLHTLIAMLLIIIILMQQSKGSGLSSVFGGGAQSLFGGRGAEPFFLKATSILGVLFMITSVTLAFSGAKRFQKAPMLPKQPTPIEQQIPQQSQQQLPKSTPSQKAKPTQLPLNLPKGGK